MCRLGKKRGKRWLAKGVTYVKNILDFFSLVLSFVLCILRAGHACARSRHNPTRLSTGINLLRTRAEHCCIRPTSSDVSACVLWCIYEGGRIQVAAGDVRRARQGKARQGSSPIATTIKVSLSSVGRSVGRDTVSFRGGDSSFVLPPTDLLLGRFFF